MKQEFTYVSHNLKNIRESRGLSLEQLSELTGVSKSMIRQIETGKSSPTISTLWKIANGLKISFSTLISVSDNDILISRLDKNTPLTSKDGKYKVYPTLAFNPKRSFEKYYLELESGTTYHSEPHKGDIEEIIEVKSGMLIIEINGNEYEVNSNEYIHFKANHPHSYINRANEKVSALLTIVYI